MSHKTWCVLGAVASVLVLSLATSAHAHVVISDDFESYTIGNIDCETNEVKNPFTDHGWSGCRTHFRSGEKGNWCSFTAVSSISGFSGSFPSGSKAIRLRAESPTEQVDCHLGIITSIPASVWLQVAIYPVDRGSPGVARPAKFWYPCGADGGTYPCRDNSWLPQFITVPVYPLNRLPSGFDATCDMQLIQRDNTRGTIDRGDRSDVTGALGPTSNDEWIKCNRWNIVKLHFDTSNASACSYKAWIGAVGSTLTQVANWVGGTSVARNRVTCTMPNTNGHSLLVFMSSIPSNNTTGQSAEWYFDDVYVASAESDLPTYGKLVRLQFRVGQAALPTALAIMVFWMIRHTSARRGSTTPRSWV